MVRSSKNSTIIQASPEKIYKALTDAKALQSWQAPERMTAKMHYFDLRVGGGYSMSLYYPESEKEMIGKTTANEDRFTARFVELIPNKKIVQVIQFNTTDEDFMGKMDLEILLQPSISGTKVTFTFKNIPPGIAPEDNEAGTEESLQKLAEYVDRN